MVVVQLKAMKDYTVNVNIYIYHIYEFTPLLSTGPISYLSTTSMEHKEHFTLPVSQSR